MENQCSRNNDSEKKQIKFFGIIGAGVFIFICLCITLPLIFGIPESGSNEPQSNNVKLLMDTCGVTEEQANGIENILANCEITKIDEIKHDSLLDDMIEMGDRGYRVEAHGVKNIILYVSQEGEARAVRHAGFDMFFNDTYQKKLSSFYLTASQETTLQIAVQNGVKSVLTSPSSAKFPLITNWSFYKDPAEDTVTIESYVEAKNAFGTMIRTYFVVIYEITGDIEKGGYSLKYFKFGNNVIVDNQ